MTHIDIYTMAGKKTWSKDFSGTQFEESNINHDLIQEYVVMYNANKRVAIAHTKVRGEVAGSGRKLYRQKGTGSARVGDARSPIRRKGWVVFWPRSNANFAKDMNQKMKKKALSSAFILQLHNNHLLWLESYTSTQIKTKDAVAMLNVLPNPSTKTLVVLDGEHDTIKKSLRNIETVTYVSAIRLNAYELMDAKRILFVGDALDQVMARIA